MNRISATRAAGRSQLLRVLGAGFTLAVVVGGTIGVGILRAPAPVAGFAGSAVGAMLFWVIGGIYALIGASIFAELATSVPRSGGIYIYAHEAFGDGAGFLVGCADLFATSSSIAFASIAFVEFAALLWPALAPWQTGLAAAAVVAFALSQLGGVRFSSVIQQVMTAVKALAFIALVVGLLLFASPAPVEAASTSSGHSLPGFASVVLALQLVIVAYDGWTGGSYFAGENRASARAVARAMLGGVLLVIAVYVTLNIALLRVMPFEALAASKLPVAEAARVWLGERGGQIVTAIAALSLLPLLGVVLMVGSRIAHAMASDGLLPRPLAVVDRRGTPVTALLGVTSLGLLLIGASGGVLNTMLGIGAVFAVFSYIGGFAALLRLRAVRPDMPRPYRAPGFPVNVYVALAGALGLAIGALVSAPRDTAVAVVLLGVAGVFYHLVIAPRRRALREAASEVA